MIRRPRGAIVVDVAATCRLKERDPPSLSPTAENGDPTERVDAGPSAALEWAQTPDSTTRTRKKWHDIRWVLAQGYPVATDAMTSHFVLQHRERRRGPDGTSED
jgi:hypothetical protein